MSIFGNAPGNNASTTIDASKTVRTTNPDIEELEDTSRSQQNFGQKMSFHITDLLEQSINVPREKSNIRATIDFYKRSVKPEAELNKRREIIIKNYRLRLIDAAKDLSDADRRIMKLNKGTSIYVANSLIKPEIYRYSTKVTSMITELFPFLNEEGALKPPPLNAMDMESLNLED